MDIQNKLNKIICHDCGGNGFRRDCYGEVYQCKECNSQGEIAFTEEEMLENIDDAGLPVWKEKYQAIMVIGVQLKRNVCLKLYTRKQNEFNYTSNNYNYYDCSNNTNI